MGRKKDKKEKKHKRSSEKKSAKRKKKESESESEIEDSFSDDLEISEPEEEEVVVPKKRTKKAPSKAKKGAPAKQDDDDDEKFDDGFDENLLGDEADREYILSLNEVEREAIIADRYQKRKQALDRFELQKKLKRQQAAGEISPEPSPKRRRTSSGGSGIKETALSDLKKRRAARTGADSDSPVISDESEPESESDSDDFRPMARSRQRDVELLPRQPAEPPKAVPEPAAAASSAARAAADQHEPQQQQAAAEPEVLSKAELQRLTLPRNWLEAKLEEPYFDKLVIGFFVRIGIGLSNERIPVYRVAEIIDVGSGKRTYKLGKRETNKIFTLKHGGSAKPFTLENISNKDFTDGEFGKWQSELQKHNVPVLTSGQAKERAQKFGTYKNYQYTEEDIANMVKRKGKESKVNIPAKRKEIQAKKEAALEVNDEETVAKCDRQLSELDRLERRERERQSQQRTMMLRAINDRSRQENIQQMQKKTVAENLYADPDLDPFSRRQTRTSYVPTSVQEIAKMEQKKKEADAAAAAASDKPSAEHAAPAAELDAATAVLSPPSTRFAAGESAKAQGTADDKAAWRTASMDGELAGLHDFDLEDLRPASAHYNPIARSSPTQSYAPTAAAAQPPAPSPASTPEAPKRTSLSINDYKKRLGLI
eukprot:TRINITY_DN8830_c0_g1_i1.p1 TRINITY_DN8830_c0_g1~~TRINITY_DN8830_c0_g1_i1.p1  ORF type:complete len:654 (-),score=279.20 TRINITY_DN8830_c0_g1_i1:212-2173(-)